jgi:proliferating cell nuclear antigen
MFALKAADAKKFRDVLSAASTIVDEATFNLDPSGIKMKGMDPSRIAMVDLELPSAMFEKYECTSTSKLCVNMNEFLKLLKRAGKDESLELALNEATGRLQIKIVGKHTREFNMSTLTASEEEIPAPKLAFNVSAKVLTAELGVAIEDAELASDHVRLEADEGKLVLIASGELLGATIVLEKGSDSLMELNVKEPSKATYSLSYLVGIIKAAAATASIVVVEFSTDMPVKLDFQQEKGERLVFFLAPRIEDG